MSDQMDAATTRFISRAGEAATVYNWSDDGTVDDYGDPDFTRSSATTTAVFRRANQPQEFTNTQGETVVADARVWVDSADASSIVGMTTGDSNRKATHIKRDATGTVFKVLAPWDEGNGLTRCWCVELPDYEIS